MSFQQEKERQLMMEDNSDIGKWDEKIARLCNKLNKQKEYYTTSSCAGRIVLIKAQEKKEKGLFLYRTHDKIKLSELKKELKKAAKQTGEVYFKQEQCILHAAANSLESAQKLLDSAKLVGWKHSGIIASGGRFVCELRSTERIEFLIISKGKILVDDNFLVVLVRDANSKLERTWEKIDRLEKII